MWQVNRDLRNNIMGETRRKKKNIIGLIAKNEKL